MCKAIEEFEILWDAGPHSEPRRAARLVLDVVKCKEQLHRFEQ